MFLVLTDLSRCLLTSDRRRSTRIYSGSCSVHVTLKRHSDGLAVTLSSFLTFASRHAEAEEVGLAALAPKAGDARLTLALSRNDVTLAVGGANGIAVAPVGGSRRTSSMSKQHNETRACLRFPGRIAQNRLITGFQSAGNEREFKVYRCKCD